MEQVAWGYQLTRNLWTGLDWVFPPTCGGCGHAGIRWCADCQQRIQRIPESMCKTRGTPYWQIHFVNPVPLSSKRLRERGYNQVSMVALPFALKCMWGYRPRALHRTHETRSQVGLSKEERRQNVRDAFVASSSIVDGRFVLVEEDVTTTGATLSSCVEALLRAGARQIYWFTIARALAWHGLKDV